MGNNKSSAEVVDRKQRAIMYMKDLYYGFTDNEYEIALEVGNLDFFENKDRDLVYIPMSNFMSASGPRFMDLFNQRVRDYFVNRDKTRRALCRS